LNATALSIRHVRLTHVPRTIGRDESLLGGLLGLVVVYSLLFALDRGPSRQTVLDLMNVVTPAVGALLSLLAGKKTEGRRMAIFWTLMGASLLLSAMAEATWAAYEVGLGISTPFPSIADIFWVMTFPVQFAAILCLLWFRHEDRLVTVGAVLDALLFGLATAALTWKYLLLPAMDLDVPVLKNVVSVAYPAGDVLLLTAIGSLALLPRRGQLPRGLLWVGGSLAVATVADVTFSVFSTLGVYQTGNWIDLLWPLSYAFLAAGAVCQLRGRGWRSTADETEQAESTHATSRTTLNDRARMFLPYLALPVAGLLLEGSLNQPEGAPVLLTMGSAAGSLCLIALVLARQFVTVLENRRLQAGLAGLSRELELRVEQRTEELRIEKEHLGALNQVAVAMSNCVTSKQVVDAGLQLARQALACDAIGLWLKLPGADERFFASPGLGRAARLQLATAARQAMREKNAKESTPPGGRIEITIEGSEAELRNPPFSTVTVIPLVSRHMHLGALCAGAFSQRLPEGRSYLALAEAVASEVAVAFENARRFEDARYLAERDPVTGMLNHRGMNSRIDQEIARAQRTRGYFSLVMMDLDNFKLFNDTYGHAVGDEVLQKIAAVLGGSVRKVDTIARYGGDEFLALLPETDAGAAVDVVRRIQGAVRSCGYRPRGGDEVPILLSYGIASYPDEGRHLSEVLSAADANLYRSKLRGGDTITAPSAGITHSKERVGAFNVLEGLVTTVDNKDRYTRKHSDDVCARSLSLAERMGLSDETQRALRVAALLHDVGKIGVPDHLLRKPSSLTAQEYEMVKQHVTLGKLIVKEIPNLGEVMDAIATHHERFDGSGYPKGLKGEEIPLLGRILAVSDAYSAMTTNRPYRKAKTPAEAAQELRKVSGAQLDPKLVEQFLSMMEEKAAGELKVSSGAGGRKVECA
jgi:diguanylate cyclase (GGDEF)-like protein/putative nucleotidyltransferase with HDIG domain